MGVLMSVTEEINSGMYGRSDVRRCGWLRLAVPIWAYGREKRESFRKRGLHTSREEISDLFAEELRRPIDPKLRLTPSERREYEEIGELRKAIYERS